jgi:hypothetical protein
MPDDLQDKIALCNLAFEAYAAMRRHASDNPHLLENPYYQAAQDSAYARFRALWERI